MQTQLISITCQLHLLKITLCLGRTLMHVFISCEREGQLTTRYTKSHPYHSFLYKRNLSQNTSYITYVETKSQRTEHECKLKKNNSGISCYDFQLINADCQASKRHCKIVSAQAENTIPTLEKGLEPIYVCVLIAVHIPALKSYSPTLRVQL